jgi:hypothetical protein
MWFAAIVAQLLVVCGVHFHSNPSERDIIVLQCLAAQLAVADMLAQHNLQPSSTNIIITGDMNSVEHSQPEFCPNGEPR